MNYRRSLSLLFFSVHTLCASIWAIDASITHASYLANEQPYVEFYLHVVGNTVNYDTTLEGMQSKILVTVFIKKDGDVVDGDKFLMVSPFYEQATDFVHMFRKPLKQGSYEAEMHLVDTKDTTNSSMIKYPIEISYQQGFMNASDVRLLAGYSQDGKQTNLHRNGFFLEPLPYNFYHKKFDKLSFYFELYDTDAHLSEDFVVVYGVQSIQKNGKLAYISKGVKRFSPESVNVLLGSQDISNLASGNYLFHLDVLTRNKDTLLQKDISFMRSNPMRDLEIVNTTVKASSNYLSELSGDSLDYYLKSLVPIVSNQDVESINFLLDQGKNEFKRNFIYRHFEKNYPGNESVSFLQYTQVARAIDKMYNDGFGFGFESDRGRMYLKYGRPSESIRVEDDEGAFPYEIWYYNSMPQTNQRDVRFLFYNPDYTSNRFILLTSTCRNERQLRQWELELYRNAPSDIVGNRVDATQVQSDYRRRARELYNE